MGSKNRMKQSSIDDRVRAERVAHTENDVLSESYKLKDRFSHIWTYPSKARYDHQFKTYLSDLKGKTILDYGCGRGHASVDYWRQGANVYGIDISPSYIDDCKKLAKSVNHNVGSLNFQVMDAHKLDFPNNKFDIIAGNGILHHLDAHTALKEIYRVLKLGGRIILQEPLADNPLLKVFRLLTPKARTVDEKPFSQSDLNTLIDISLWESQCHYCGILEAPIAMLTSIIMPSRPQNVLLDTADRMERWIHKKGYLKAWNQYILFSLVKKEPANNSL